MLQYIWKEVSDLQITLKAARANKGLSREKAAELLEISKYMLANYEHGKASPTIIEGRKIEAVYGISLDNIFFN